VVTKETITEIERLLQTGMFKRHVAKQLRVSLGVVYATAYGTHRLQTGRVKPRQLPTDRVRQVEAMLATGELTPRQIARALGIGRATVRRIAAGAHKAQQPISEFGQPPAIAEACRRIRSGWTESERKARLVGDSHRLGVA
jgi:hypothetical protein